MSRVVAPQRIHTHLPPLDALLLADLGHAFLEIPIQCLHQRQTIPLDHFRPIPGQETHRMKHSKRFGVRQTNVPYELKYFIHTPLCTHFTHNFSHTLTLTDVSGSLNSKSHMSPTSGTSHGLNTFLTC
jgi:hypothetical protein